MQGSIVKLPNCLGNSCSVGISHANHHIDKNIDESGTFDCLENLTSHIALINAAKKNEDALHVTYTTLEGLEFGRKSRFHQRKTRTQQELTVWCY